MFIGILGVGYVFTFFDIFNINVSWIQTCLTLNVGGNCSVTNAATYEGLPVLLNLIGYVIGAIALSPLSDRFGRRNMLLVTLVITGLGSLYNAFVPDYANFIAARTITGIGVGADLAIVNTYINEAAPKNGRARYTSLLFILAAIGVFFAIWLGLFLTTPASPFPQGLPFAIGGAGFAATNGWRLMYGVGALLALIGVGLRLGVPESPRWLISKQRFVQADAIVVSMENRAKERVGTLPPVPEVIETKKLPKAPYSEIFRNVVYRNRTILLFFVWFFGYIGVYITAAGMTALLAEVGFAFPENGMIVAIGVIGFIIAGIVAAAGGDKIERKRWLPIAAVTTFVGAIIVGLSINNFGSAVIGSLILFTGVNLWIPITYSWVTESFPTRARATGFSLADGLGHIGGAIGVSVAAALAALAPVTIPVWAVFAIIAMFQVLSAVIAQLGPKTANRRMDEISP